MSLFFGVQVAVHSPPNDPWRERLLAELRRVTNDLQPSEVSAGLRTMAALLGAAVPQLELGFWDLVPRGDAEFQEWTQGIEDDSADPWADDTTGARMDLVLVSALFLVPPFGRNARLLGERCDLPEARWMQRTTFATLFAAIGELDPQSLQSHAVYVTPGGRQLAFSRRELTGEGYDYLLPIRG